MIPVNHRGWFSSMRSRLILTFALVALLGISLVGGFGYRSAQIQIRSGVEAGYGIH
jgi:nitrate reductase NapE component